jgi:hypothetical protein
MPRRFKSIVPAEGKLLNVTIKKETEVDLLLKRIEIIQEKCQHSFLLVEPIQLVESRIPEVYLSNHEGEYAYLLEMMEIQCAWCNLKRVSTLSEMCPRCLAQMKRGDLYSRKRYWGIEHSYYASRLFKCTGCNFAIVVDEWAQ